MSLNPNVLTSREIVPPPHNTAWPSVAEKGLGVASEMLALVELVSNSNQPSKVLLSSIPNESEKIVSAIVDFPNQKNPTASATIMPKGVMKRRSA